MSIKAQWIIKKTTPFNFEFSSLPLAQLFSAH